MDDRAQCGRDDSIRQVSK